MALAMKLMGKKCGDKNELIDTPPHILRDNFGFALCISEDMVVFHCSTSDVPHMLENLYITNLLNPSSTKPVE